MPVTQRSAKSRSLLLEDDLARAFGYRFLSAAFSGNDAEEFILAAERHALLARFPYESASQRLHSGIEQVKRYLELPRSEQVREDLECEFNRLFVGPGRMLAPPYESVYLSPKRLLFQEETLEVRRAYVRHELLPPHLNSEPDDHISLELDFMRTLCERCATVGEAEMREGLFRDQRAFLAEHLLLWAPEFASRIESRTKHPYYQGLAAMLDGFLDADANAVGASAEEA